MIQPTIYQVLFTDIYIKALDSIKRHGRTIAVAIQEEAEGLSIYPEKKGYPLTRELNGLWSKRVYYQRYRIIYRIQNDPKSPSVEILFVGIRKEGSKSDVYEQAKKVLRKSSKAR